MIFVVFLCALGLVSLGSIYYRKLAMRRLYKCDWNELCRQLEPIPKMTVAQIGDEYLNPRSNQLGPEPVDIWSELGGLEGLHRMRRNARILIALAAYAENWNFTESVIVKERMRQDARHLRIAAFLNIGLVSHDGFPLLACFSILRSSSKTESSRS